MASLTVNVDGSASGAVEALGQTSEALDQVTVKAAAAGGALTGVAGPAGAAGAGLSTLGGSASAAGAGLDGLEVHPRTVSEGLRLLAFSAAATQGPLSDLTGGGSSTAGALLEVGAAAVTGGFSMGPLGAALLGGAEALKVFSSSGPAAAGSIETASGAARDAASVFGDFSGAVGVPRQGLEELAAANLRTVGPWAADASGANLAATALFAIEGASDAASTATAKVATSADELAASQAHASASFSPVIGGLNTVIQLAHDAGEAYESYAASLGSSFVPSAGFVVPQGAEAHAAGGPVFADRTYLVGEQGPELFVPSGAGSIVPNGEFGGGGPTYYVTNVYQFHQNAPVYGSDDLERQVAAYIQKYAAQHNTLRGYLVAP